MSNVRGHFVVIQVKLDIAHLHIISDRSIEPDRRAFGHAVGRGACGEGDRGWHDDCENGGRTGGRAGAVRRDEVVAAGVAHADVGK